MWRSATLSAAVGLLLLTLGVAAWCPAQTAKGTEAAASPQMYRDEALVFERFETTVRMHADGTGERLVHVVVRVQAEGAARQFGVLSVSYASAYETGVIDFARVVKPDGSTVETPVTESIEMPAPVTREAPLYSDLTERQLPVRSLAAGDRLEYQLHTVRKKAEAPGQFWGAEHFTVTGAVILHEVLTLELPSATYAKVWSPNHPATPTEAAGVRTWRWESSQLKPSVRDKDGKMTNAETHDSDQDADGRVLPSVAWTTFHSWAEVGTWYAGLARGRAQPTAAVRAKADELTQQAKTPEAQARAIYEFVSTRVRYVGIDLGIGRYQPHLAAEVLATQYGDCKDKDTLLEALLQAKGFQSAPALIGVNLAVVSEVPSPAAFNHVITAVELPAGGGRIWLDATPEVEPYRVLGAPLRDQQALVIPAQGAAGLVRTPADPPFAFFEQFDAIAALDAQGLLKGRMFLTVRSDNEAGYRALVQRAAPAQWDDAMQYVSGAMGFGGKVTNVDLRQTDPTGPVRVSYDYSRPAFADWDNRRILPLFPSLEITVIDKEKAPEHDIDLGVPRTLRAHTEIALPPEYRADLPEAIHVKRSYATFDQVYRLDGAKLTVDRIVRIERRKVPKADWKDYLAFSKAIGMESGENYIPLLAPQSRTEGTTATARPPSSTKALAGKGDGARAGNGKETMSEASAGEGSSAAMAEPGKATAEQLIEQARKAEVAGDWAGARDALQQARALDPKAPYVMSMLGYLAMRDRKPEEAITDLKAELAQHPEANSDIVLLLVAAYMSQKQDAEAISLLKSYHARNEVALSLLLARIQSRVGRHGEAIRTLETAASAHPEDRGVSSQMAHELMRDHREAEAAAAAKAAMDGSDDPGVLNENSYTLSELKIDLPLAEKQARRAVDLLEAASAARSLAEVNNRAFAEASLLTASWDTLGWILFEEQRAKEAEAYLAAAWFNNPNVTIGKHLAQVREALGRPSEALTVDDLALATEHATDSPEDYAEVKADVSRLRGSGAHSAAGNTAQMLQAMRTFRVKRPAGLKGWGTFRMQLGEGGVHDSDLVSGAAGLRPIKPELKKVMFAQAVPPGSRGFLLRDAVVSCTSEAVDCELVLMPHAGLGVEGLP